MKLRNKFNIYILPLILVIFFINYHYYRYYEKNFKQIFDYVQFTWIKNQYIEVIKQNYYYELFDLSEKTKQNNEKVIFLFNVKNNDNFDYSSTYFFNKDIKDPKKFKKQYLSELSAMINYYFYPRPIKNYSLKEFRLYQPEKKADYVISDTELTGLIYQYGYRLQPLEVKRKDYVVINKRDIADIIYRNYFIYKVINHE